MGFTKNLNVNQYSADLNKIPLLDEDLFIIVNDIVLMAYL